MYIKSLEELAILISEKRSVTLLDGHIMGKKCLPAAAIINMSGQVILRLMRKGLIIYKNKGK